ncbi:hypothetical protein ACFQ0B_30315 [Nonomuraea thailandensis]
MRLEFDRDPEFDLREMVFFTWPDTLLSYPYQHRATGATPTADWMRAISFRDDSEMAHLFLDLLPYAVEVGGRLDAQPGSPVACLLRLLLSSAPHRDLYLAALECSPNPRYTERVLRQLEADAHRMPAGDVITVLYSAGDLNDLHGRQCRRVVEMLEQRPDLDPEALRALRARQPQDQPGPWPALDPEVSPVSPGDVPGDRQP